MILTVDLTCFKRPVVESCCGDAGDRSHPSHRTVQAHLRHSVHHREFHRGANIEAAGEEEAGVRRHCWRYPLCMCEMYVCMYNSGSYQPTSTKCKKSLSICMYVSMYVLNRFFCIYNFKCMYACHM